MNISYTFKNFEPSEHLKKYAARRFEKLARFIPKADNADISVGMSVDKFRHKIEVLLTGDNSLNVSAVETSQDMYASVDMVLDKLESQLKKHFEKIKEKRRSGGKTPVASEIEVFSYQAVGEGSSRQIVGVDYFEPKPMHVDEAAMQLEQRDDDFLVFLNAETDSVSVLYKRSNGSLGLIVPPTGR